jgi:hypothetical protein
MAKETTTIVTVAVAIALVAAGGFRGAARETGETRELVNRPDCWTGDVADDWDRCDFLSLNPERDPPRGDPLAPSGSLKPRRPLTERGHDVCCWVQSGHDLGEY